MRWCTVVVVVALWLTVAVAPAAAAPSAGEFEASAQDSPAPAWHRRLDRMLDGHRVSVTVRLHGATLYSRRGAIERVPASNQKLLLTLALLDTVDPASRFVTSATAEHVDGATVAGNLWLVGSGDPSVTGGGDYRRGLRYRATGLKRLARSIRDRGITQITGSVMGDLSAFSRDWWATGWRSYYPAQYAPLPSGLTYNGNVAGDRHVDDPEARAARALTRKLRALGVQVGGEAGAGTAPAGAAPVASVTSVPLVRIVRHMNRGSSNFHAEVLGKYLAAADGEGPVTIAGGAATVQEWAAERGVTITAHDSSGLSWSNRASTQDLARLLDGASATPTVRSTLARPGRGTLERRLGGVRVRAKTGSLPGHSALSGYVYLQRRDEWASFSILCENPSKQAAAALEDDIVRVLEERAA